MTFSLFSSRSSRLWPLSTNISVSNIFMFASLILNVGIYCNMWQLAQVGVQLTTNSVLYAATKY